MMRGYAIIAIGLLSACVGGNGPMPLAESGPVAVEVAGAGYLVDLMPISGGQQMTVWADAAPMTNDQGLAAKSVVEQFCQSRGKRVDPRALGRYQTGTWAFNGGCV